MTEIIDLPFVVDRKPRPKPPARPRCFWQVQPTGDFEKDCVVGERYPIEYLRYEASTGFNPILGWIVGEMPQESSGIEVGFLAVVGMAASAGRLYAEQVVAHWGEASRRDRDNLVRSRLMRSRRNTKAVPVKIAARAER